MFRYYLGVALLLLAFALFSLILSSHAAAIASIFVGLAAAFIAVAFITSGRESRW